MTERAAGSFPSVGFISLGCAKNQVDAQVMAGTLVRCGATLAPSPECADVVLVNTCAFIEDARRESASAIQAACQLKAKGRCRAVVVAGCLPQRYGEAIRDRFPEVDAFVGLDQLTRVADMVARLGRGESGIFETSRRPEKLYDPPVPGLAFSRGAYAWLKIAEGCNHRCAFCAIPGIRGAYRSRAVRRIRREAESLLSAGFRELDLVCQDVTSYGSDLGDGSDLPGLLRELGRIGGRFWIRMLYAYPTRVTADLIAAVAEVPQVCRYFDLPIQHSHPEILRRMGRGGTAHAVRTVAAWIRDALPDAALRATCLVGYPGESEAHFADLLAFVEKTRLDHLGVFVFSPEEGTPAAALPGRPKRAVAEQRKRRLLLAQRRVVADKASALLRTEAEVLLDRRRTGRTNGWIARSARQAPEIDGVTFVGSGPKAWRQADFVRVRLSSSRGYDLKAEPWTDSRGTPRKG